MKLPELGRLELVYDNKKRSVILYTCVSLLALLFFISIWNIRIVMWDDVQVYILTQLQLAKNPMQYFFSLGTDGSVRLVGIFINLLGKTKMAFGLTGYRIHGYLGMIIAYISVYRLLNRNFGKYYALLSGVFLFAFFAVDTNHNLSVSYNFTFFILFFFAVSSVHYLIIYLDSGERKHYILSFVFFAFSLLGYELFVPLFAIVVVMIVYNVRKLNLRLVKLIAPFAVFTVIYSILFYTTMKNSNWGYTGVTVNTFDLLRILKTNIILSTGEFPIVSAINTCKLFRITFSDIMMAITTQNVLRALIAALGCFLSIEGILKENNGNKGKKVFNYMVLCLAGIIFACTLYSITVKYQINTIDRQIPAYLGSAFSFVIAIIAITIILPFLFKYVSDRKRVIANIAVSLAVFLVTLFITSANSFQIDLLEERQLMWDNFEKLAYSQYLKESIPDNSTIVLQQYAGIHFTEIFNEEYRGGLANFYLKLISGKNIRALYSHEKVESNQENLYSFYYSPETNDAMIAKLNADGTANEIEILPNNNKSSSFLFVSSDDVINLCIDGNAKDIYTTSYAIATLNVEDGASITGNNLNPQLVAYFGNKKVNNNNITYKCQYGEEGFAPARWNWFDKNSEMIIKNPGVEADIYLDLEFAQPEGYSVWVKADGWEKEYQPGRAIIKIHLEHGDNIIEFSTNAPKIDAPDDTRSLYFRAWNIRLFNSIESNLTELLSYSGPNAEEFNAAGTRWIWFDRESDLVITNHTNMPFSVDLSFVIGIPNEGSVFIENDPTEYHSGDEVRKTMTILPGDNKITLTTNAERVDAPSDPRSMYFQVANINLSLVED